MGRGTRILDTEYEPHVKVSANGNAHQVY
jgi:hypothetical protein